MKNIFKRLILLGFTALVYTNAVNAAAAIDTHLDEMHKKIEKLHHGFELIFLQGKKEGHIILSEIQAIPLSDDESAVGKKLNILIKELNAIFKTVHHIVTKYCRKGKSALVPFLLEIGKSCNLEALFKKTISELEEIKLIHESVNEKNTSQNALKAFIDFLKRIQPIWHDALSQKELIVQNLRASL